MQTMKEMGAKGGKATAAKRTAQQRADSARKAARARWPGLDPNIFEVVLAQHWFVQGERDRFWSNHRVQPFLKAGYAVLDREETADRLYYRPTPEGMAWWLKAMLEQYPGGDANRLARFFEGFGVGGEVKIYCFFGVPGVFPALENGIVEFVSMNDPWTRGDRTITVRLTRKGMEYFDSLPRIQYDLNC